MSFAVIVWDECSLNNKYVFGFVLLTVVETSKHARKIIIMLSPETLEKKMEHNTA